MKISAKAIMAITASNIIMAKLMILYDKGQATILNWVKAQDLRLQAPDAVKIISEESGLSESQILERAAN